MSSEITVSREDLEAVLLRGWRSSEAIKAAAERLYAALDDEPVPAPVSEEERAVRRDA